MHVHYRTRGDQRFPTYVCVGRGRLFGDPLCQSIAGTQLDAAVGEMIVGAVTPMAIELTLAVQQEIQRRVDDADRLRHRQVERAQYEADLARQRYLLVCPVNRLVADSLEADWNARLRLLDQARDEYQRLRAADRLIVDDEQRRCVLALATEFPTVWRDPSTPDRERKRMLALLIEDVTLIKQHQITAAVRLRGGATTTLTLPRPPTAQQLRARASTCVRRSTSCSTTTPMPRSRTSSTSAASLPALARQSRAPRAPYQATFPHTRATRSPI
jgi:hypothetical protein